MTFNSVHSSLNGPLWPLQYATVQRLANLQNRLFAVWARAHGVAFLDLAAQLPQDPRLFIDRVHASELGSRLRAWLMLAGLAPRIQADLQSGVVPVPDTHPDPEHPFLRPAVRLTAEQLDGR